MMASRQIILSDRARRIPYAGRLLSGLRLTLPLDIGLRSGLALALGNPPLSLGFLAYARAGLIVHQMHPRFRGDNSGGRHVVSNHIDGRPPMNSREALEEARACLCSYTGGPDGACGDTIAKIDAALAAEPAASKREVFERWAREVGHIRIHHGIESRRSQLDLMFQGFQAGTSYARSLPVQGGVPEGFRDDLIRTIWLAMLDNPSHINDLAERSTERGRLATEAADAFLSVRATPPESNMQEVHNAPSSPEERPDRCPACRTNWRLFPPAKCDGSDHVRCVDCKAVYPASLLSTSPSAPVQEEPLRVKVDLRDSRLGEAIVEIKAAQRRGAEIDSTIVGTHGPYTPITLNAPTPEGEESVSATFAAEQKLSEVMRAIEIATEGLGRENAVEMNVGYLRSIWRLLIGVSIQRTMDRYPVIMEALRQSELKEEAVSAGVDDIVFLLNLVDDLLPPGELEGREVLTDAQMERVERIRLTPAGRCTLEEEG